MPGPAALAVDTTGPWCGVIARDAAGRTHVISETLARGHTERLAPMAQAAIAALGLAPKDLGLIAAATGPGSFAGARVGVAFARGLALATRARAVGVSSLDAWARAADPRRAYRLAVVHDAKRGEVIWKGYAAGAAASEAVRLPLDALEEVLGAFAPDALTGSGAGLAGGAWRRLCVTPPALEAILALADEAAADAPPPQPVYARPPDADLPGGRG